MTAMTTEITINPRLHARWKAALAAEYQEPCFRDLKAVLLQEQKTGQVFYPPGKLIFNALDQTSFDHVKVVIIGQDPYHGPGQAPIDWSLERP